MSKLRVFPESNYLGVWDNKKTTRYQIINDKPITELKYPEFYDIKITEKCSGECPYCYQSSQKEAEHYPNIVERTEKIFGPMSLNQRPFQVALGGGNPNEHPDFVELVKWYADNGICPNYTTNGIGLTKRVLDATYKYCGGVAISCHPHLESKWRSAIGDIRQNGETILNAHIIISDNESIEYFHRVFQMTKHLIDAFVALPYVTMGRAEDKRVQKKAFYDLYMSYPKEDQRKIAFGAGWYNFLKKHPEIPASLYDHKVFSKYIDMKDMSVYHSSYEEKPIRYLEV
jgi:hypothetical protein